ncbi:MAG: DUF4112 domain-containing protein [Gemmatimonadota bacterium]
MPASPDTGDPARAVVPVDSPGLRRFRALAWLLDEAIAIPGTRYRVGVDAIVGLVPGVGDVAGGIVGGYGILVAFRAGVSRAVVLRMVGNILLDALVGQLPILGDLFDVAFKSNIRNRDLIDRYLANPTGTARASRALIIGILAALLVLFTGAAGLSVYLVVLLVRLLTPG